MPKKVQKTFRVEDGKLQPRSKAAWFWRQLQMYEGKEVHLSMGPPNRSIKQNAYLWGVVYKNIRLGLLDAGQAVSSEAIHEHMKRKYIDPDVHEMVDMDTGEVVQHLTYTTTDLNTTEFSDYIERIKQDELILQLGIYIPAPGEKRLLEVA